MILINIKTNFRLIAKLIDSESLYYLIIKNLIPNFIPDKRTVTIEEWRDIENPSENLEEFKLRLERWYWNHRIPEEGESWKDQQKIIDNPITDIEILDFSKKLNQPNSINKFLIKNE